MEKYKLGSVPTNSTIMGCYFSTPEIFGHLDKQQFGAGGEIQLTGVIKILNEEQEYMPLISRANVMMLVKSWGL